MLAAMTEQALLRAGPASRGLLTNMGWQGRVVHGTKPGPRPYLSTTEEAELSSFLKSCSNMGYGRTRTDVMGIA